MKHRVEMAVLALAMATLALAPLAGAQEPTDSELLEAAEAEAAEAAEVIEIEGQGGPREQPPAGTRRAAREAAATPGAGDDAIAATQTFAGVARLSAGRSELVLWGASPGQTRLTVDGMPVPRLLHVGGARSILPTTALASVEVIPGGAGARHGRGIGGLVSIETARPDDRPLGLVASLDPLAVSVSGHARSSEATSVRLGARRGLLTETVTPLIADDASELVPLPQTWDYHGRVDHTLASGDRLRVTAIGSGDRLERGIPSTMPTDAFTETRREQFHRVGVSLARDGQDAAFSDIRLWLGSDNNTTRLDFGDVAAFEESQVASAGLLLAAERWPSERARLRYGLDLEARQSRLERDGAVTLPGREGDIGVFGQAPGNRVNADRWTVVDAFVAGYVSAWLDLGSISIEPGLRVEPALRTGDRVLPVRPTEPEVGINQLDVHIEPRLRLDWRVHHALSLSAAAGRYHQTPDAADRSPVFGNPRLASQAATQIVIGATLEPVKTFVSELALFTSLAGELTARSPLPTPRQASLLVSTGEGRTIGAQISSTYARDSFSLRALVSAMRAQRRASSSAPWRAFDFDQRYRGQVLGAWRGPWGLELGARVELASGFPRTPVVGAVFNAESQTFDPIFGEHNSERLPAYVSLSLRASIERSAGFGRYRVWLDVHNATNHDNGEELVYTSDYSRRELAFGLPVLPIVGVEVTM